MRRICLIAGQVLALWLLFLAAGDHGGPVAATFIIALLIVTVGNVGYFLLRAASSSGSVE